MTGESVLVVDDEPGVRSMLEAILRDEGYRVAAVATGEEGLERLATERFDAVLLDVWLPGIDGLEALTRIRDRGADAEVVMISGHGTIETAVRATKLGAFDFVEKPLSLERTLLVLRNALRQRRLERANRRLLEQLARDTAILGTSRAAERLRGAAEAAGGSDAPVLLCGEPGSGRESVARRIHAGGRRAQQPFVPVNCAALDAATGARVILGGGSEPGRLGLATGGSLFLEDADVLDEELQSRLAARLEGKGGGPPQVRILASAGPDPTGLVGALRVKLDVVRIVVPPLRSRREDIPLLAARFIRDLSREYGRVEKRLSEPAMSALVRHDWPGNVRELRNVLERLVLLAPSDVVGPEDLPPDLGGSPGGGEDLYRDFASLREGLEAFERHAIRRALERSRGDAAVAARSLGLTGSELVARIDALRPR